MKTVRDDLIEDLSRKDCLFLTMTGGCKSKNGEEVSEPHDGVSWEASTSQVTPDWSEPSL